MPTFFSHRSTAGRARTDAACLSFEQLEPRLALAVVISEFLADNESGIRDYQGDRPDWIELYNDGGGSVNIGGWHLTDDDTNLTKWTIPTGTMIGGGGRMTIFASSKDQDGTSSGGELHTNFNLSNNGEYLALVMPGGTIGDIVTEFDPYPLQYADVSYGTGVTDSPTTTVTIINDSSAVSYLVPTGEDAATDDHWREIGFDDSGWGTGTGGVGKDVNGSGWDFNAEGWIGTDIASEMSDGEKTAYIRYEFDVTDPEQLVSLDLDLRLDDGFIVYLNGREMARANFGEDFILPQPAWNSDAGNQTTSTSADANHVGTEVATPVEFDFTPYLLFLEDDGLADGNDNVLAFHGVNTASTGNLTSIRDFLIQPVLTAARATGSSQVGYMVAPSPGRGNGVSTLGIVADTEFSHHRGFYTGQFDLTISTTTPGATIRYTTDGSIPTLTNGTTYAGPIDVDPANITSGERGVVMIRAAAFKSGYTPTNVDTQTYIFLDKVILQDGSGIPAYETWGSDDDDTGSATGYNGDDESDWEMDPTIVSGNETAVIGALQAVPTMSLVMDWDDLFSGDPMPGASVSTGSNVNPATQGIYIVGASSERPASLEFINPDAASDQFQVDTVVEIQGHSSTLRWRSDKMSFQVKFKLPLADPNLDYPLFAGTPDGDNATTQFDTLILDAGFNYWWHHANTSVQGDYARFVPDQVVADLQNAASGSGGPHGKFVHLYVNGLYWGLYYAHERPDDSFAPQYYGGDEDDYYVVKHANQDLDHKYTWVDGGVAAEVAYEALLDAARAVGTSPTNMALYEAVEDVLDIEQFIDYMIVHFYGGNANDWPHNNWYATYNHVDPNGKWRFHAWDQEHAFPTNDNSDSFNQFTDATTYNSGDDVESPLEVFVELINNDEFRLKFADRTQALLFDGGPLTEANAQASYEARVDEIFEALIAESARWGDNRVSTPYTQSDFNTTTTNLLAAFFPVRSDLMAGDDLGPGNDNWNENGSQFENHNWLVALEAPEFSLSGNMLTLTDPQSSGGTIWYTLDGSDPRDRDTNGQSGTAVGYTGSITLSGTTQVRARIIDGATGTVDDWSALADETFVIGGPLSLRIVELMYHPPVTEDLEYIELLNTGTSTISLAGVQIGDFANDPYAFSSGSLAAGERIVVAKDPAAFAAQYPTVTNVAATGYPGNLSNGGELITLRDALGNLLQSFTWGDASPWPTTPDGDGYSLVYVGPFDMDVSDPSVIAGDPYDDYANWQASTNVGGSPGTDGSTPPLAGDYDGSGTVDDDDYTKWKLDFGTTVTPGSGSDGNGDGMVDAADYTVWRNNYGATSGPGSGTIVASAAVITPAEEVTLPTSEASAAVVDDLLAAVQWSSLHDDRAAASSNGRPAALGSSGDRLRAADHIHRMQRDLLRKADRVRDNLRDSLDVALGTSYSWLRRHGERDGSDDEMLASARHHGSYGDEGACEVVWDDAAWLGRRSLRRLG